MAEDKNTNNGLDGLSEQAYEIARRRKAAAQELIAMLEDEYETWFGSSAASLLRACAWLAGTSLYRSFGFDRKMQPGSPVLSDKANTEGMKMLKVFMFLVAQDGIQLKPDDFAVPIPDDQKPVKNILEAQEHFQDRYNDIMRRHDFDYAEGGKTGAVACARLLRLHCVNRTDLEPPLAATIVTMGFVEGTKTAPAPLGRSGQGGSD